MINNFRLYITDVENVRGFYDKQITHLISIGSAGMAKPYVSHYPVKPKVFRLNFDDIRNVGDPNGPQVTHIEYLLSIAKILKITAEKEQVNLLVHCHAGISRSTAASYIVLNYIVGPGKEKECLNAVYEARPWMAPNEAMCIIADKLLQRGGKLESPVIIYNKKLNIS